MKKNKASSSAKKRKPTVSKWARRDSSSIHGSGLYAKRDIPEGTKVIEYVGELVNKKEATRRDQLRRARQDMGDDGCVYLFEVNKRSDIDGDVPWNTARLINHSCEPNCEPQNIDDRIWIIALRDIEEGEELSYDYGFDFEGWEEHPCRCGKPSCVGFIVKKEERSRVRKVLAKKARKERLAREAEERRAGRILTGDLTDLGVLMREDPRRSLAVAESLTSGQVQVRVGAVSGASDYFLGGVTAYTLRQKVEWLGVSEKKAEKCDCVSEDVARQMARGVAKQFGAKIGVATTGYAEANPAAGVTMPHAWWAVSWKRKGGKWEDRTGRLEVPGKSRTEVQGLVADTVLRELIAWLSED